MAVEGCLLYIGKILKDKRWEWVEYIEVNTEVTEVKERIVREVGLSIFLNKKRFVTAMIMSTMEREFIIGHLFGQEIIENIRDMELTCPPKTIPVIISQKGGINGQKGIYSGTDHQ